MYQPDLIICNEELNDHEWNTPFFAKNAMLCSFLSLFMLNGMLCSSEEVDLIHSQLKCLETQVKTPHNGYTLLHVLSDLQDICDTHIDAECLYVGHK